MVFYCVLLFYLNKKRKISIFSVTVYFLKTWAKSVPFDVKKNKKNHRGVENDDRFKEMTAGILDWANW